MHPSPDSTLFDSLSAAQREVLQALVAGQSVTAAAKLAGVHRTTVHLWTRQHSNFAHALLAARQDKADRMLDELGDLADLAINTFRQILSDEHASPATRLKAAMEVVKLVETQRPTIREVIKADVAFDRLDRDLSLAQTAQAAQAAKPPARATEVGRYALPVKSGPARRAIAWSWSSAHAHSRNGHSTGTDPDQLLTLHRWLHLFGKRNHARRLAGLPRRARQLRPQKTRQDSRHRLLLESPP